MIENEKKIIENIKIFRLKRGYSQYYMADKLNISQNAYSKIESQKTRLTIERLNKIATIFSVELIELIP